MRSLIKALSHKDLEFLEKTSKLEIRIKDLWLKRSKIKKLGENTKDK